MNWNDMKTKPAESTVVLVRLREFGKREFAAFYKHGAWFIQGLPKNTKKPVHAVEWSAGEQP